MYSVMLMRLHSGRRESATMRDGQQEVEIRVSRAAMDEGVHHILVDLPLRPVAPGGAEAEFVIEHPVLQGVRLLTRAAGVLGLLPGQVEIALLDLELAGALGGTRRFLHGLGKHLEQAGLLVNGHMAGIWKHEHKGRTVSVEISPFAKLPRWTRTQIDAEAERLAAFVGGDLKLKIL